jgi:hypothetical protein
MNKAAAVTFCAGILAASISANSARSQSVCPRGSAGFIQAGGQTICIGGSADLPRNPVPRQQPTTDSSKTPNLELDSTLNTIDLRFRDKNTESACGWTNIAIMEANRSGASVEQSALIKGYAKRCNLRY